jgi:hypothetical protein
VIALVVLLPAVVAVVATVYGILRTRQSDRGRILSWGRVAHVAVPQRLAAGTAPQPGGRHRLEDARTGSLSATAILQALNAKAGEL